MAKEELVARRKDQQTKIRSRLAAARAAQGITQEELADAVGISRTTLVRLERKAIRDPRLGWFVNCSIALDLPLDDVIDDDQLTWYFYDRIKPPPPGWVDELRAQRRPRRKV